MARPRRDLDPTQASRLAEVRSDAGSSVDAHYDDAPGDELGRVAWIAGSEVRDYKARLAQAVQDALDARFTWREITFAIGENGEDPDAVSRLRSRYRWARQKGSD